MAERHRFPDGQSAAHALADRVVEDLTQAIATRGDGVLVVSGGRTPRLFFEALSGRDLDWSRVTITLADERWVPETNARSNAALVRSALLRNKAAFARFQPLFIDGQTPHAVAAMPPAPLRHLLDRGFDSVVLGFGLDGHFASIFPGPDLLPIALDPAAPPGLLATRSTETKEPRLTFNLAAFMTAKRVYLQSQGAEKHSMLMKETLNEQTPLALLLAQRSLFIFDVE
ncbi:MAG: 6-phosphogluconolactonase [Pseudomonadota bacterium]